MLHSCIAKGCTNKSNNPECYRLSWYRLLVASETFSSYDENICSCTRRSLAGSLDE